MHLLLDFLGIRYPEELAFKRYLSPEELRKNVSSERRGSLPSNQYDQQGQVRSPTHNSRSAYEISNQNPQGVQQHTPYDPHVSGYSLPRGVSPGATSLPVSSSHTPVCANDSLQYVIE